MSHLSEAEVTAGISRKALETFRRNGMNGTNHASQPRSIGDGTTETPVIETPYRRLSVLESFTGGLILRDACFVGSKCDVSLIHLEYHEAHALAKILAALEEGGEAPVKRGRA